MAIKLPYQYTPRHYQLPLWGYMFGPEKVKRAVVVRHRRAGKDTDAINICATKMFERVGTYMHIFPTSVQGRNIIWTGLTRDGKKFTDFFPRELIAGENGTFMSVTLKNKSVYKVAGSDNPDSLRGVNPVGVVMSEYQDCDPDLYTKIIEPILMENGGWAMFLGTPKGKNHFYEIYDFARNHPTWHHELLTIRDTRREDGEPVIKEEEVENLRQRGVPEETIQAEYYCSFEMSIIGAYYAALVDKAKKEGRVAPVPYDERFPVHTAWDVGWADTTVIVFFQFVGQAIHVIDCYSANTEPLTHYARVVKERGYDYGEHFAPHDMAVHESAIGKSRLDFMREHGIKMKLLPKLPVQDGIEQARAIFGTCWFDEKKCGKLVKALNEYTKEWNEMTKAFRDTPRHDWSSHFADAFRYLAMSLRKSRNGPGQRAERVIDNYEYV